MSNIYTGENKSSISSWTIKGGITIKPHIVINKYSENSEMINTIQKIKKSIQN